MELAYYFPKYFKNTTEDTIDSSLLLARAKAELADVLRPGEKSAKELYNANRAYMKHHTPRIWNVNIPGNKEVQFETSFNQLLISVCSELKLDSNTLTTFEFYNALELLEKRNKND